jgi:hypothetical protein
MKIIMPKFEIHILAGVLAALIFHNYPLAAIALIFGSIFPDIDCRKSITHRWFILGIGVISVIFLYPYGLLPSLIATLSITGAFLLLLPKHRNWLHKFWGQLLFGIICFVVTLDPLVAVAGIIGTTIHRILDGV